MNAFERTVEALGLPLFARVFRNAGDLEVTVARWRHGDACVSMGSTDDLRIALSLGGVQQVSHRLTDASVAAVGRAGDVGILPAVSPERTCVRGNADIFQVFVSAEAYDACSLRASRRGVLLASQNEQLRSSTLRLFVNARLRKRSAIESEVSEMLGSVRNALTRHRRAERSCHKGGMPPQAMRRLQRMITERVTGFDRPRLRLRDLASEARMSECQVVRAFHHEMGTTPHQYILSIKHRRALDHLADPSLTIADTADRTGFSSPAHFAASFRQRFGVRPVDYRDAVLDR